MTMSKITKSAEQENCQIRIPGICNFNPKTTVFAHLPGAGWGIKHKDNAGSYSCSNCHDAVDGRVSTEFVKSELDLMFFQAVMRTQMLLIDRGLIILK